MNWENLYDFNIQKTTTINIVRTQQMQKQLYVFLITRNYNELGI